MSDYLADELPIDEMAFTRRAVDPRASAVVEACAGSAFGGMARVHQSGVEMQPGIAAQPVGRLGERRCERHSGAERRARKELPEPAMEGFDRRWRGRRQDAFVQPACPRKRTHRVRTTQSPFAQERDDGLIVAVGERAQRRDEPRTHFLRCSARERDGENLAGRRAVEQQAHDARNQQPGLAAAGAGFDHRTGTRIDGTARERDLVDRPVIGEVVAHGAAPGTTSSSGPSPSASIQWPRRHRPRISQ